MSATSTETRTEPLVPTGTWNVDPGHSSVQFAVKHMGIANVRGSFQEFEGAMEVAPKLADSRAYGKVMVASITTGDEARDAHLRSADFFDAENYPEITFQSTRVTAVDDETSSIWGDLTMHGVTREIRLEAVFEGTDTDPWGNERVGITAAGVLKRSDFDMKFNEALGSGNMLVGDKVTVSLDISAVRAA
jgi:polyisoprenoid-binding protein YceI